jgi:hypothetical protein
MPWTNRYRIVVVLNLLSVFAEFVFAELLLEGHHWAAAAHGFTAGL